MHPTPRFARSALLLLALTACRYDAGDEPPPSNTTAAGSEQPAPESTATNTGTTAAPANTSPSNQLAAAAAPLEAGAVVPPFVLANATEALDSRGPLANGPLVVVFYIGDFCVYCRRQLTALQQRKADFDAAHATVWGVSADTTAASQALARDLSLGFPLGSDPGLEVIRAFGVASEGTNTARPAVFVLTADPSGGARVSWRQVGAGQADRAAIDDILTAARGGQPAAAAPAQPAEQPAPAAAQPAEQPPAAQQPATQPAGQHPARPARRGRPARH